MRRLFLTLAIAAAAWTVTAAQQGRGRATASPPPATTTPRLVVLISIDQFRANYIERYQSQWTRGLHRLVTTGAFYPLAAYPYAVTKTCAGHSTISTGTFPWTHGMIDNAWYDRVQKKSVTCTEDATVNAIAFGGEGGGTEKHSGRMQMVPAFADELRLQAVRPPRIVSMSLKARSAIGLGGHGGPQTMVFWQEEEGTWETSTAYASAPWPEVDAYIKAHPIAAARGSKWTRLKPESAYFGWDKAPGEPAAGQEFPYTIDGTAATGENSFMGRWQRSPLSDAYLNGLAMTLADKLLLGQQPTGTDMLAVGYTALDLVCHQFGPFSHEVQDLLMRLDEELGLLFAQLDKTVGAGRYVVALSADHGVAPLPEQAAAAGFDAGRTSTAAIRKVLQSELVAMFGEGTHLASVTNPYIVFSPGIADRIRATPDARRRIETAMRTLNGMSKFYWSDDIASSAATDDDLLRMLRRSYYPGRSGDFAYILKPYWLAQATGTTHGSPYDYDRRVPVMLMGAGIRAGQYFTAATPADIAPTLALLTGITLSRAEGRVLVDALQR